MATTQKRLGRLRSQQRMLEERRKAQWDGCLKTLSSACPFPSPSKKGFTPLSNNGSAKGPFQKNSRR